MKTFILLAATAMLFFSLAACRKPDLHNDAGTREFTQPSEVTQPMDEKNRSRESTMGNGDGMQNSARREIIVKFKSGTARETVESIAREHGLEIIKTVSAPHLYLFRMRGNLSAGEVIRRLNALVEVEYAEPNYTRQTQ